MPVQLQIQQLKNAANVTTQILNHVRNNGFKRVGKTSLKMIFIVMGSEHLAIKQKRWIWMKECLFIFLGGRNGGLEPELRKRTSSLSTPHRAVDVAVDPAHSAILFRDARGVSGGRWSLILSRFAAFIINIFQLPVTDPFVAALEQFTTGKI